MNKEDLEKLIKDFQYLNSKYTLEEIIQSILDDKTMTNEGKLRFIQLKLEMSKADRGIIEILETELKKTITSYE